MNEKDNEQAKNAPRTSIDLLDAAETLTNLLDEIHESPSYKAVWSSAYIHGVKYTGKTYQEELKRLKKEIVKAKQESV
jgi:hypothetical protein